MGFKNVLFKLYKDYNVSEILIHMHKYLYLQITWEQLLVLINVFYEIFTLIVITLKQNNCKLTYKLFIAYVLL